MRRFTAALAAVLLLLTPAPARANPVSASFADTFADPMVLRGDDGYWYAYGTTDPLREGEKVAHRIPTARSSDLTSWTYLGDAFTAGQRPAFAAENAVFWAPDVRRSGDHWIMYVTVTETTVAPGASAIGAATAPTPAGPWTFADEPVVAPRPSGDGGWLWTFDPAQLTTPDGRQYLYYGSYFGGIWVSELSADGLRITGTPTRVAIDNKFEGAYVVRRDGWYYLFASSANCCAGPTTGYSVSAGRSRSPRGPFTDRDGLRLDVSRAGGTPVIAPNGNRWVGTGHNGLITDLAGQDWLAYHAIDRADPYLDEPFGINERPMLLDRLDWIDGWPTVRAGAWASDRLVTEPVTRTPLQDRFDTLSARTWQVVDGRWAVADGRLRGQGTLVARKPLPGDLRVEADLRGPAGLTIDTLSVRAEHSTLVIRSGRRTVAQTHIAPSTSLRHLSVERRGGQVTAMLDSVRLDARVHGRGPGIVGLTATAEAEWDNLSAGRPADPVRRAVAVPQPGRALNAYSDDFRGTALGAGWSFVRPDAAATVSGGALRWPVQNADLTGDSNTAGVLLRDAPAGRWIAETKVTLDLGEDTVRNYQQAGIVAYAGDDEFARLSAVAIWNTRQVEFGHEIPYAGATSYGGTIVGAPGLTTTWLRLAHSIDPRNGEHEYRAGVSRDGRTWTWGGVWTLPADSAPRIGLVAHGGAEPPVTAAFDYLRFSRW
ncbi:family 43 glycosylhydrolase [Actinoplanes friuliensis]|uniref:Glycoside hydrolase family 43 protein n=1 Tax=Actinoplanes friuliensis DSM 7358 TaxID=1246995 RepID=U5WE36_9ACTN|nr:family 43 glycosylhydrolase [Actinoplanes friuliensis]AGZ46186.1 glycoside hydrolase family 43 protein [Actinoplanes friuliensis DSM 7358]